VEYVIAAYAISVGAVAVYLGRLSRERRRLARELGRE
jgi:heme exporter protein CcmD